ncbi:hypothetical protein [Chlorogloea sp. CCALA 695]|uniref:hypothetical protein n=1 Tax=Chlorogloea sp. CCALA 695 TaxID=2107693 RepID=UPI000D05AC8C|nr:hypothetical protein [Chlorogloea sp. CCALA 695]PSB31038.1 hypothetical protein C7B70_14605 [Chlorogloea sp. CCALA 695]
MKVKLSLMIELKPEIEARLLAQAIAQRVSVENLLEMLIENYCVVLLNQQQSDRLVDPHDRLAVLKALGKSPSLAQAPSLSEDAIARESIYREREDAQL